MSANELQACLARLYTNSAFAEWFALDPEGALGGYFLTPDERSAITTVDPRALKSFAASLVAKRRGRFEYAYPALFALGGPALDVYCSRYHDIYPLRPGTTTTADALRFGAFMEETLVDAAPLPGYARDLVRFERTKYRLRGSSTRAGTDERPLANARGPDRCPDVALMRFDCNIDAIATALYERRDPVERAGVEFIAFVGGGEGALRLLRVSPATALVIDLCDGERTTAEVVAAVESHYGRRPLVDSVTGVIGRLRDAGVLENGVGDG